MALTGYERLGLPERIASGHEDLARYLDEAGQEAEARDQRLAGVAYRLILGCDPGGVSAMLSGSISEAAGRGEPHVLPRLSELLAKPAFARLRDWLSERTVSLDQLQADIDKHVNQLRS